MSRSKKSSAAKKREDLLTVKSRKALERELNQKFLTSGSKEQQEKARERAKASMCYTLTNPRKNTLPSKPDTGLVVTSGPKYVGEMAAREAKAQEEIGKKKKRTGVLFNKGGYQYISDDMDLTTLGKK